MKKIIQIAVKDFMQTMREPVVLLWILILPLAFTGFLGAIFGGIGAEGDVLIPVGYYYQDAETQFLMGLQTEMGSSVPIEWQAYEDIHQMRQDVSDGLLAGAIIFPSGITLENMQDPEHSLTLIADTASSAGTTVEANLQRSLNRLASSSQIADVIVSLVDTEALYPDAESRQTARENLQASAKTAWQTPAVTVVTSPAQMNKTDLSVIASSYDQSAPGMIVQFSINGLLGTAIVIVMERRSQTMQRLLTNALNISQILAGHALYIFTLAFVQQSLLVIGGQFIYGVNYLRDPASIWIIITAFSFWITGLGMLIGVMAKNSEQVILYSLIAMFFFTAFAGAWFPLEITSSTFYRLGHLTPGAWAMDGFQNIIVRGLGFSSVLKPAAILTMFGIAFLAVALLVFWLDWRKAR